MMHQNLTQSTGQGMPVPLQLVETDPPTLENLWLDVQAEKAVSVPAEVKEANLGEQFDVIWKKANAGIDAFLARQRELRALEDSILPCETYMAAVVLISDSDSEKLRVELSRNLYKRLVRHAEKSFAPVGDR